METHIPAARPRLRALGTCGLVLLLALYGSAATAQPPGAVPTPSVSPGDTAWMLSSAALVLFMTPGLALFYAGMVRSKNVLNMMMQSFVAMAVVSCLWAICGYSLAFSKGSPFLGGLDFVCLRGVLQTPYTAYSATVPHQVFMVYQMMFAIITPALISGAIAERMKFGSYVVFICLWSLLVYCPIAHMVWGQGGYLRNLGVLDFAGGTVVHISSGVSALVLALFLGQRHKGHAEDLRPHNLPMTLIGTAMLWFGWFGFNAGSALASNGLAGSAFVATHLAAASAGVTWLLIEWAVYKKPTALGMATGAVAGLAAVTQAVGYIGPMAAMFIGVAISCISFLAIRLKNRLGYDDTLDVFGVHGVGGIWGALAVGLFASTVINPAGANGLLHGGGFAQLAKQAVGIAVAIVIAAGGTTVLALAIKATLGLSTSTEEQTAGLDLTEHGETAYSQPAFDTESNPLSGAEQAAARHEMGLV